MKNIKAQLEVVIRREFPNGPYPLEARRCLHWADTGREDLLVSFLPDLEALLQSQGKGSAAGEIAAMTQRIESCRMAS